MKNQFLLAFNEICKEKNLPPDTILEALQNALVSAYRRNNAVGTAQGVEAEIDPRTGEVVVYAEKEVVEDIQDQYFDDRTEVKLAAAQLQFPDAQLGDMVMAESTPKDFGRVAAQTAKQVILQRVREAERDHLYDEFSGREGEIVNGTVQSLSGGNITIGLGRTEALLPRREQVQGERYRAHDKIRVYITEVKKSGRGPQIFVSRAHRHLLRRLLELEVPEIYNGQVDIKSIAREAGQRSKVAVQAMQPGVDPVGACVGMRGVRIQSIVRELNDEKIDVIEWDPDPTNFIAKALSPARVSHVFLDDDPNAGRTATVIVPDDQLSLAIGREGQNARLAAKLTSWRIDIKSLTEAGSDSLALLGDPAADPVLVADTELHDRIREVLAKKEASRPITAEDFNTISKLVAGVEGNVIAARAEAHDTTRRLQSEAHAKVPEAYWEFELEELNLPLSIHNLLLENGYEKVGPVAYQVELNSDVLFELEGFNEESLEKVRAKMADLAVEVAEREAEEAKAKELEEAAAALVAEEEAKAALAEAPVDGEESVAEAETPSTEPAPEPFIPTSTTPDEEDVSSFAELMAEDTGFYTDASPKEEKEKEEEEEDIVEEEPAEEVAPAEPEPVAEVEEEEAEPEAEPEPEVPAIDDLSQSLVSMVDDSKKDEPKLKIRRVPGTKQRDEEAEKRRQTKEIVFDENAGRAFSKKKRKSNRQKSDFGTEE